MLQRVSIVDRIEVIENGCVQVRVAVRIMDGESIVAQSFHRHVIAPGDDFSAQDQRVQAVCAAVHTAECIAAYQARASSV